MPRKDGTGPEGKGPRAGRGLGNCDKPIKRIVAGGRKPQKDVKKPA